MLQLLKQVTKVLALESDTMLATETSEALERLMKALEPSQAPLDVRLSPF